MSNLDSIIACDTLVMLRYAMLTYIAVGQKSKFYATFDCLRDQNSTQCFGIKLLKYFMEQLSFLLEKLHEYLKNNLNEQAMAMLKTIKNLNVELMPIQAQMKWEMLVINIMTYKFLPELNILKYGYL